MASGSIKAVVPKSDIVDNLTTNDSTKVLSAAQGYALNGKFGVTTLANGSKSMTLSNSVYGDISFDLSESIYNYSEVIVVASDASGTVKYSCVYVVPTVAVDGNVWIRQPIFLQYFFAYGYVRFPSATSVTMHFENTTALTGTYTITYKVYGKK